MKRFFFLSIFILYIFLFTGCGIFSSGSNAVLLRVKNVSNVDFSSVLVKIKGTTANYGAVASGKYSEYREFNTAYRYGYVEVEANDSTYRIQPTDYVGEVPLENGHYTYKLDIVKNHLSLEFERE